MINRNLMTLRKRFGMTQEELAEKIQVSRQTIAKWEKGESIPDIEHCIMLAELFEVSLDSLIRYSKEEQGFDIPPKGRHFFGTVTLGERGQIVIPKKAREVFHLKAGDQLLVFGDEDRGIGIVSGAALGTLMGMLAQSRGKEEDFNE